MPIVFVFLVGVVLGMIGMFAIQGALKEGEKAKRAALARQRVSIHTESPEERRRRGDMPGRARRHGAGDHL